MKLLDKLKNVFFEEVEEEVEEEEEQPKVFAKKVDVPKKKFGFLRDNEEKKLDNFLEEKEEEPELKKEEKFEPKEDIMMEEIEIKADEPEAVEIPKTIPMMFDDDDFLLDKKENDNIQEVFEEKPKETISYRREKVEYNEPKELYQGKKETSYMEEEKNPQPYTYTKTTYVKETERKVFKPSPIISPIYGILDKNYRKEEVVTKRETRISGSYEKPDLDSVRNKAFASYDEDKEVTKPKNAKDAKYHFKEEKKVYDVNNDKPEVSRVTIADADEYYNDLGLAYNVDYSDASRNNNTRSAKYSNKDKKKGKKDVDDNLFDLIDSMYSKED